MLDLLLFKNESFPHWLGLGDRHLASADKLLPDLKGNAAFHYNQATERYLKAFLVKNEALKPADNSITDLRLLAHLCIAQDQEFPRNCQPALDLRMLDNVNAWASLYQYPPESGPMPALPSDSEFLAAHRICSSLRCAVA
jgi:HEPN domain-containing protein